MMDLSDLNGELKLKFNYQKLLVILEPRKQRPKGILTKI